MINFKYITPKQTSTTALAAATLEPSASTSSNIVINSVAAFGVAIIVFVFMFILLCCVCVFMWTNCRRTTIQSQNKVKKSLPVLAEKKTKKKVSLPNVSNSKLKANAPILIKTENNSPIMPTEANAPVEAQAPIIVNALSEAQVPIIANAPVEAQVRPITNDPNVAHAPLITPAPIIANRRVVTHAPNFLQNGSNFSNFFQPLKEYEMFERNDGFLPFSVEPTFLPRSKNLLNRVDSVDSFKSSFNAFSRRPMQRQRYLPRQPTPLPHFQFHNRAHQQFDYREQQEPLCWNEYENY